MSDSYTHSIWNEDERTPSYTNPVSSSSIEPMSLGIVLKSIAQDRAYVKSIVYVPVYDEEEHEYVGDDERKDWGDFDNPYYACSRKQYCVSDENLFADAGHVVTDDNASENASDNVPDNAFEKVTEKEVPCAECKRFFDV